MDEPGIKLANQKLIESAGAGDEDGLRRSLADGAGVNAKNNQGWTAAMLAAYGGRGACLGLLIVAKADLDAKDEDGWTAAMRAAHGGHEDCLAMLIAAKADLDGRSGNGWTAAMAAGYSGHGACLDSLMAAGADIEATDNDGWTAATLAKLNGHRSLASFVEGALISEESLWSWSWRPGRPAGARGLCGFDCATPRKPFKTRTCGRGMIECSPPGTRRDGPPPCAPPGVGTWAALDR